MYVNLSSLENLVQAIAEKHVIMGFPSEIFTNYDEQLRKVVVIFAISCIRVSSSFSMLFHFLISTGIGIVYSFRYIHYKVTKYWCNGNIGAFFAP